MSRGQKTVHNREAKDNLLDATDFFPYPVILKR